MQTTMDVAYNDDEDFPALMQEIEKEYEVKVSVVKWSGSGGGWPEMKFEGSKENLTRLLKERFDDEDGYFASELED